MKFRLRAVVASVLWLAGCRTAHNVAVSSYHVVTAPARVVHRKADSPPTTDVANPGRPVAPTPTPSPQSSRKRSEQVASKPSPSPRAESALRFPTAKAVPDKPGFVYSPSDPSKYVDVSGYASGSKVKDPYSGKIFLVP